MTTIYTDGACSGNPGVGGWAFFVVGVGCWSSGKEHTTNNEMELTAIAEALEWTRLNKYSKSVTIITDSTYCMDGFNKWMDNWVSRNWRTASNSPVKNQNLWLQIYNLSKELDITFKKVKAHSGDVGNEYVDKKAVAAMNKIKNRLHFA